MNNYLYVLSYDTNAFLLTPIKVHDIKEETQHLVIVAQLLIVFALCHRGADRLTFMIGSKCAIWPISYLMLGFRLKLIAMSTE